MTKRMMMVVFPRNKYKSTVNGVPYLTRDRKKFAELAGNATRVTFYTRVYAYDTGVTLNFTVAHSGFADELPLEGARLYDLTPTLPSGAPTLPYGAGSMANLPDDGVFAVTPTMGRCEIKALAGGAAGSVEFETWATLEFDS